MALGIGKNTLAMLTGKKKLPAATAPYGRGIGAAVRNNQDAITTATPAPQQRSGVLGGAQGAIANTPGLTKPAQPTAPEPPAKKPVRLAETDIGKLATDITSQDSEFMRNARTQGLQSVAARGLLSSTMAIQAAENEAYKAAMPLAQSQAEINASRNENRLQRRFDATQNNKDRQFERTQKQQDRRFEGRQNNKDRQAQYDLKDMDLDAVDRAKVADMMTTAKTNYESALDAIMKNENLSAEDRETQVRKLRVRHQAWMAGIQDLYNVDISFR